MSPFCKWGGVGGGLRVGGDGVTAEPRSPWLAVGSWPGVPRLSCPLATVPYCHLLLLPAKTILCLTWVHQIYAWGRGWEIDKFTSNVDWSQTNWHPKLKFGTNKCQNILFQNSEFECTCFGSKVMSSSFFSFKKKDHTVDNNIVYHFIFSFLFFSPFFSSLMSLSRFEGNLGPALWSLPGAAPDADWRFAQVNIINDMKVTKYQVCQVHN